MFIRKRAQISKAFLGRAEHSLVPAEASEQPHQGISIRAGHFVGISVSLDVPLLQAGEMPVERGVIILPV